jgi:hypothetical protein
MRHVLAECETALEWVSPDEALDKHAQQQIRLPPPTWLSLFRMSKFKQLNSLAGHLSAHSGALAINLPFHVPGEQIAMALPGDQEYGFTEFGTRNAGVKNRFTIRPDGNYLFELPGEASIDAMNWRSRSSL